MLKYSNTFIIYCFNQMKKLSKKLHVYFLGGLLLSSAFIWYLVFHAEHQKYLTVAFLNIGQGDSIYVEAPNGNQVIVDGGPDKKILSELGKVMPFYDRSIDMLVVTNPDKDHYAGFIDVLNQYNVSEVLESGTHSKTSTYAMLEKSIHDHHVPKLLARRGMKIMLDEKRNIYLDILFPDQDVSNWTSNDGSIVMKLMYGNTSVMLTGDTTAKAEHIVLNDTHDDSLHSTILKVGHHGSKTSSSEEFLKAVEPSLAVISAGFHNRYGLPKQEILDRLSALHIRTLITYEQGTIIMESDGKSFWRK